MSLPTSAKRLILLAWRRGRDGTTGDGLVSQFIESLEQLPPGADYYHGGRISSQWVA
jgi:hypothetical protein